VLDTDPPGGATRICGVADDVASCRQAEVGVVHRGQKPRGSLRRPSLHDPTRIKPAAPIARAVSRKLDRECTIRGALGLLSELDHLGDLGWALRDRELAAIEAIDDRVRSVDAEDQVYLP
jgi:hypothetical protein